MYAGFFLLLSALQLLLLLFDCYQVFCCCSSRHYDSKLFADERLTVASVLSGTRLWSASKLMPKCASRQKLTRLAKITTNAGGQGDNAWTSIPGVGSVVLRVPSHVLMFVTKNYKMRVDIGGRLVDFSILILGRGQR